MINADEIALSERGVSADLNTAGYGGKWKQAKRLAVTHLVDLPYWMRVRQLFLELGGERKDKEPC